MFYLLAILCFGQLVWGQLFVDDLCTSKRGQAGRCRYINDCKPAIEEFEEKGFHSFKRCGFEANTEVVCCVDSVTLFDRSDQNLTDTTEGAWSPAQDKSKQNKKGPAEKACDDIKDKFVPPTSDHIIGGKDARAGEFPHMAALGYLTIETRTLKFICGGSLISELFIVTAGHCLVVRSRDPKIYSQAVRLGVLDLEDDSLFNDATDYNVVQKYVHPLYKPHYYDLALVKLDKAVTFASTLHPVCLNMDTEAPAKATVTGWGLVDVETRKRAVRLQKTDINIVTQDNCSALYKPFIVLAQGITKEMICAGGKGVDTCQGDSGGPLQTISRADGHFRIIGITSFGHSCGTNVPGVYTRISSYIDWIESIVWPTSQ